MTARVRVTEEQLLQALRDLGAVSSETAVTTRKVAQQFDLPTYVVNDDLYELVWSKEVPWRRREPVVVGKRSNGGPNYWWAIEGAS